MWNEVADHSTDAKVTERNGFVLQWEDIVSSNGCDPELHEVVCVLFDKFLDSSHFVRSVPLDCVRQKLLGTNRAPRQDPLEGSPQTLGGERMTDRRACLKNP